ncbi:hypothetical protein TSTA_093620 [Talaromyces stipitatus ATCC 10500]|uniref:Uncharacterized protein n=1 Tax=Talaromyces stipitatus (strain ATCC 10500 / CBS 375.48 / QM 6759 / NRRL 1006) TaxID=441959 RepID=B8M1M9_TALSN|nr:uncharacterized protein TSTA_093620 [Talaromyces stipitatus ATCC 10500]EED22116.1 hypothetical protein TSTA_093620 [Talaromyces stipitatus ATCC 10500]
MSRRSSSGVIDLTSSSRSHRYVDPSSQQGLAPHIDTSNEPRGTKRRRLYGDDIPGSEFASSSNDPHQTSSLEEDENIESVDLTEVNDDTALARTLAKQREDAIKAQTATGDREGRTTLTATKCAICMDTPTDATTTIPYDTRKDVLKVRQGNLLEGNVLRVVNFFQGEKPQGGSETSFRYSLSSEHHHEGTGFCLKGTTSTYLDIEG